MGLYKFFPEPNEKMAELWTLITIKDCAILEYGPAGTTHFAIEGFGKLQATKRCYLATTDIDGSDVALGITKRLDLAIDEVVKNLSPKYLFVCASSVSSTIGTDILSICQMLQTNYDNTKLIALTNGGLSGNFTKGLEDIYLTIVKNIVQEPKNKNLKSYNIIGSSIDDLYFNADSLEIIRMLKGALDLECRCIFTSNCTIEEIEAMSESSINIVIRKEALKVAKYLEEKYNIPYIYDRPYGLLGTTQWLNDIANTLNLEINNDFIDEDTKLLKEQLGQIRRLNFMYPKKCLISGNYDTVKGIERFAREEGKFTIEELWCNSKMFGDEFIPYKEEPEWLKIVKGFEGALIMSDATAIYSSNKGVVGFQISNPNLEFDLTYPYTPLVGYRGALYILQQWFNIPNRTF